MSDQTQTSPTSKFSPFIIGIVVLSAVATAFTGFAYWKTTVNTNPNSNSQNAVLTSSQSSSSSNSSTITTPNNQVNTAQSTTQSTPKTTNQTYRLAEYPDLEINYDPSWKLEVMPNKDNPGHQIRLIKNQAVLEYNLAPAFATGFTGPLPCYDTYKQVNDRFIRTFEPSMNRFDYEPDQLFEKRGYAKFDEYLQENVTRQVITQDQAKTKQICGGSLSTTTTKTTLPVEPDISDEYKGKAYVRVFLSGTTDPNMMSEADKIFSSTKF